MKIRQRQNTTTMKNNNNKRDHDLHDTLPQKKGTNISQIHCRKKKTKRVIIQ